jgi:F0F1-type ATP synthase membrane subunit a
MNMISPLASADPIEHVLRHFVFQLGPFEVTNQMVMAVVAAVLMLITFVLLFNRQDLDAPPSGLRNLFESIMEFLRVEVIRPALKEHTDRFVPFLWTVFFFILFCNLLGQIPVDDIITLASGGAIQSHFWGTATGTPLTTGALAVMVFFVIHISGVQQVARSLMNGTYGHHPAHEEHSSEGHPPHEAAHDLEHMRGEGLGADVPGNLKALTHPTEHYRDDEHIKHHEVIGDAHAQAGHKVPANIAWIAAIPLYIWNFAPHPFRPAPGASKIGWIADVPMWAFLLILELIGALIKPFALMIRLFANMIAGHIVLAVLILLIPVTADVSHQLLIGAPVTLLSLLIRFLELFVGFLQAYIFTFLATLFIASAIAPEH